MFHADPPLSWQHRFGEETTNSCSNFIDRVRRSLQKYYGDASSAAMARSIHSLVGGLDGGAADVAFTAAGVDADLSDSVVSIMRDVKL